MLKFMTKRVTIALVVAIFLSSVHLMAVEYPPFEGRLQLTTERFEIVYEPQDAWAAEKIVGFADDVYEQLTTLLDHRPKRPIPVVITSRPVQANGYFSPFPPKVILYITSAANRFLGSRSADWLHTLFVHELTHYIHLTAPIGPAKFLTPIFGPDVPAMNTLLMPGWWVEGITTYTESTLLPGGRGDSPTFAFTYEAPLREQAMWSLSKGAYNALNPPPGRIYTTGYLMVDRLYRDKGPEAFVEINRRFARWPFFGMGPAFKQVTGRKPTEVFDDALEDVLADLTDDPIEAPLFSPKISGDFSLPFVTDAGIFGQANTPDRGDHIVLYPADDGMVQSITRFRVDGRYNVAIPQDGTEAFITSIWSDSANRESIPLAAASFSDLYRYDFTSKSYERLTHRQRLTHPTSSADGKRVVAIEPIQDRYRLVAVDVDSKEIEVLYENPNGSVYEPSFSMDGTAIVAIETIEGMSTITRIDADGERQILLPYSRAEIHSPRFIDAQTIWFSSDFEQRLALYELSLVDNSIHRILTDPVGILGAIRANGQVIYSTYTSNGHALRCVPSDRLEHSPFVIPLDMFEDVSVPTDDGVEEPLVARAYRDRLRYNLWVPVTMDIPELVPGATVMFRSLLSSQVLQASAGFHIKDTVPVAAIRYQLSAGPFIFQVLGRMNEPTRDELRQHAVNGSVGIPLWRSALPTSTRSVRLLLGSGATYIPSTRYTITGSGSVTYDHSALAAPKDYFGSSSFAVSAGMSTMYRSDADRLFPIAVSAVRGQLPIGRTHQVVRLDIEGGWSLSGDKIEGIAPMGFEQTYSSGNVEATALITARYRIPFGIIDQPIPHGGIIGMGITAHGQTLVHAKEGTYLWEDDVYMGLTLNSTFAIGASFTLNASAGFALSLHHTRPQPYFRLDFANMFSAEMEAAARFVPHN